MTTLQLGLISDTHMPKRWKTLPPAVLDVFAGVDLILHAGDVGELWVLDQLSPIAPVVAVHGNDETSAAEAALPYLQTLSLAGQRIVLTHAHFPDRAAELDSRVEDLRPMLTRRATMAREHGAKIIVLRHTHIPMVYSYEGVLLVNPGAIASGNPWLRQTVQTVARMTLQSGAEPNITHYNLAQPNLPYSPPFDLEAGFSGNATHFSEYIVTPEFLSETRWLWDEVFPLARDPLEDVLHEVCHEVWSGQRDLLEPGELIRRWQQRDDIPAQVYEMLRTSPTFAPYL